MSIVVHRHVVRPQAPASSPNADADFLRRSTAPGVFRVFKFNDDTFLNLGLVKRPNAPFGYAYRSLPSTDNTANTVAPSIDHTVFASGTGSLHFQFPSQSGQDAAGSWQGDFSDDCSVQFGPASEAGQTPTGTVFYAQWQQMWDDAWLNTQIQKTQQGVDGSKLCIICTGDVAPGFQSIFPSGYLWGSCEKNEVVLERYGNTHYFQAFAECSGNEGFMGTGCQTVHVYWPMTATTGGGNFLWQNGMPQNACCWNNLKTLNGGSGTGASDIPRDLPGCFNLKPNVWYTIQIMIDCGPTRGSLDPNVRCSNYYARKFDQSRVKVWLSEKGTPGTLIIDWNNTLSNYEGITDGETLAPQFFARINLDPLWWHKDPTQVHPPLNTWCDELILSQQRIPDPLPLANLTIDPRLVNLGANQSLDAGAVDCTTPTGETQVTATNLSDNAGGVYDPKRLQFLKPLAGGHDGTNYNSIWGINLTDLTQFEEYPPTPAQPLAGSSFVGMTGNATTAVADPNGFLVQGNYDFTRGCWLAGPTAADIANVFYPGRTFQTTTIPYPIPAARHTVDQIVMSTPDEITTFGLVEGNGRGSQEAILEGNPPNYDFLFRAPSVIWHYDRINRVWTPDDGISGHPYNVADGYGTQSAYWGATCRDPISGLIIWINQHYLRTYDPTTRTLSAILIDFGSTTGRAQVVNEAGTQVASTNMRTNGTLEYRPVDGCMYYFTMDHVTFRVELNRFDFTKTVVRQLTTGGTPPVIFNGGVQTLNDEHAVRYDTRNDLFGTGPFNGIFYAWNPVTKNWASNTIQGAGAGLSVAINCHDTYYSPEANVYMFKTDADASIPANLRNHIFFYRWA